MHKEREKTLLGAIVQEYIDAATPVASESLVKKYSLHVSSATVRNDMATLEEEGYVHQPHSSSGRIPTPKGYQFYIQHFLPKKSISFRQRRLLNRAFTEKDLSCAFRALAKAVAELSSEAVLLGLGRDETYYTGISYLFVKPEFRDYALVTSMSAVIDHLDDVMPTFFDRISDEPEILIGDDNPLGHDCSVVVTRYAHKEREGVLGIFGPLRMDYGFNIALVRYARGLVAQR